MVLPAVTLWFSLVFDRFIGDPPNRYHPVAWVGRFIGWWGRPSLYSRKCQRGVGVILSLFTALLFAGIFLTIQSIITNFSGKITFIPVIVTAFLLSFCMGWRSLEEHVARVRDGLMRSETEGKEQVQMLVSRNTGDLSQEEVLSAAYESMAENLVDSIISPLFFFGLFGLVGAAFFRAYNTMDAMLGYKDERRRIGWFPARMDDLLNYIPARLTGALLLFWFATRGRFSQAWNAFCLDRKQRPGINGGIPMAIIAGGTGVQFQKRGVYTIGPGERTLLEAGGDIQTAVRAVTLLFALLYTALVLLLFLIL